MYKRQVNGRAIIPSGTQRRIRNTIKESGYLQCKLGITSEKSGVSGRVSGKWSPDVYKRQLLRNGRKKSQIVRITTTTSLLRWSQL